MNENTRGYKILEMAASRKVAEERNLSNIIIA